MATFVNGTFRYVFVFTALLLITSVVQIKQSLHCMFTTHFIDPERMKGLSWPSWLTCSGWLIHISGHPSAAGRAQDRESSPARDQGANIFGLTAPGYGCVQ